jgi:hypothetical protein
MALPVLAKVAQLQKMSFFLSQIKGTGTRDNNSVFMAWFDRSWLGGSPADNHNFFNSAFNFIPS